MLHASPALVGEAVASVVSVVAMVAVFSMLKTSHALCARAFFTSPASTRADMRFVSGAFTK